MKSTVVRFRFLLGSVGVALLVGCGGGGSDSGGAQNDVTSCITTERTTDNGLSRTTFLNTCDFAVNFGRGVVTISEIITLQPGGSGSAFILGGFIACRPPSQPIDRDDSAGRDFACTG